MDVVAVLSLGTSVEREAPILAADLGVTSYEAALLLRSSAPIVVLKTPDRARALALLTDLRARGHDAVACDADAVVSSTTMTSPRSFRFDADALVSLSASAPEERLPLADLVALVRAVHDTRAESVETIKGRKLSAGRALLTGGLLPTKATSHERTRATTEREPVLYLFRRGGAPWLLAATRIRYEGLGAAVRPSQLENFGLLVTRVKEHARHAPYDERLVSARLPAVGAGGTSAGEMDLRAHLLAMAISRTNR